MEAPVKKLYERAADLLSETEFQSRVDAHVERYAGLLDQEAAAMLVVDELGRSESSARKLSEIQDGEEATICGKIEEISELRRFRKKDGREGRVQNVLVTDGSAFCRVVLWDSDVELVEKEELVEGASIRVVNGRVKDGKWGLEVHVGRSTVLINDGKLGKSINSDDFIPREG